MGSSDLVGRATNYVPSSHTPFSGRSNIRPERVPTSLVFSNGKPKKCFLQKTCECGNVCESHVGKNGHRYFHARCKSCRTRGRAREACEACGYRPVTPELLEVDHILPRARGGDNSPENLQTLCANCHKVKTLLDRKPDHEMRALLLADGLRLVS